MQIKDIAVCAFDATADIGAIRLTHDIAARTDAHVACSAIGLLQTAVLYNEFGMAAAYVEQLNREKALVNQFWDELRQFLSREYPETELRRHQIYPAGIEPLLSQIGRHADLTVIRSPQPNAMSPYDQAIEAALLGSGRPVLIVPDSWQDRTVGERILLGWDAGREASRAAHDCLLLARQNTRLTLVTVDARTGSREHGEAPGLDMAAHLARHGLDVDLRNEAGLGAPVHEVILQAARDTDADLIVIGGYRHSRLQQTLFGGVTRSLLGKSGIPLLMSH